MNLLIVCAGCVGLVEDFVIAKRHIIAQNDIHIKIKCGLFVRNLGGVCLAICEYGDVEDAHQSPI
jgi:hypothetical protein